MMMPCAPPRGPTPASVSRPAHPGTAQPRALSCTVRATPSPSGSPHADGGSGPSSTEGMRSSPLRAQGPTRPARPSKGSSVSKNDEDGPGGQVVDRPRGGNPTSHSALRRPVRQQQRHRQGAAGRRAAATAAAAAGKAKVPGPEEEEEEEKEEEEDEEEEEDKEEGEEAAEFTAEEAERLIFGDKDFTRDTGPQPAREDRSAPTQRCRAVLEGLSLEPWAVELVLTLQQRGKAPKDPEGLGSKVQAALEAAGGPGTLADALERLAVALSGGPGASAPGAGATEGRRTGSQEEGWRPSQEDTLAALLAAPRLLAMPASAVTQRAKELEATLKVTQRRARELCCGSPALLLVPRAPLEAKLKALHMATGLGMEACAGMITLHMFPDLRLGT